MIVKKESDKEGIKADIRQGKEYPVLVYKWETTLSYIKRVASEMRRTGEKIFDRRSLRWKRSVYLKMKLPRKREEEDEAGKERE